MCGFANISWFCRDVDGRLFKHRLDVTVVCKLDRLSRNSIGNRLCHGTLTKVSLLFSTEKVVLRKKFF